MKTIPVVALLAVSTALCLAQDRLAETLRKGVVQEETRQDLNEAIKSYEAVLAEFEKIPKPGARDRKTAATALFRIAECHRKQGHAEQAATAYRRIVNEFGGQEPLVAQSRAHLAPAEVPSNAATAQQDYRKLREEARKRLEAHRAYVMKLYQLGAISKADLPGIQRKLLETERKLAAHEAGLVQLSPGTRARGASDKTRSRYRSILVEQIGVTRAAVEFEKIKYDLGVADLSSVVDAESDLTDLELELAEFDAAQRAPKAKR